MTKFKKRLTKRVMAMILSGAMVMSNMTVYASEAPEDTGGGYVKEADDDVSKDSETESKSADNQSEDEESVSEETSRSEDNASTEKDDTDDAKETSVEAAEAEITKTEVSDDEQTSETESSLRKEVEEAESTEAEDETEARDDYIKEGTLQAIPIGTTAEVDFSVNTMGSTAISGKADGEEMVVGTDNYFSVIFASNSKTEPAKSATFYFFDESNGLTSEQITGRLTLGGEAATDKRAVKFITSEAVDVTVLWTAGANDRQQSILNESGETVATTDEASMASQVYVSTMTLESAGTYYLGGNNYLFGIKVAPKEETKTRTEWDFASTDLLTTDAFQKCTIDYYGLKVDANNSGKFQKQSQGDMWINANTIVRVPIDGRSKLTITATGQYALFTVDGAAASTEQNEHMFWCNGKDGYARIVATGGAYINKIKVEKIESHSVSGTVSGVDNLPSGLQVIFTDKNDENSVITADVEADGTYNAVLYEDSTYTISLSDENYDITSNKEVAVTNADISDCSIVIAAANLSKISGSITGVPQGALTDLAITFMPKTEGKTEREAVITTSEDAITYEVGLESDIIYDITAEGTGIKDYEFTPTELSADSTNTAIVFNKRATHNVNLDITSYDGNMDVSGSDITFTDVDDEEYTYTFKISENNVMLRDGTYSISLSTDVEYPYQLTYTDLVVDKEDTEYTLNFQERMVWDFTISDPALKEGQVTQNNPSEQYYNGLYIDTSVSGGKFAVSKNDKRVQVNSGTKVKIPVSGKGTVTIAPADGNYTMKTLAEKDEVSDATGQTGSTIAYTDDTKYILFEATGLVWLTKIEVTRDKEQGGDDETEYVAEGTIEFGSLTGLKQNDIPTVAGITFKNIKWNDTQHGLSASNGAIMGLNLSKKANVSVVTCCFGSAGANATVTASSGTVSSNPTTESGNDTTGMKFDITGIEAGVFTLTFGGGSTYIHSITVEYFDDVVVPDGPRTIDVWDFGGKEETDTNKYTNNITPQKWIDSGLTGEVTDSKGNKNPGRFFGGTSTSYTYDFGDLTMNYIGQDRLYSKNSSLTTPIVAGSGAGTADKTYDDGYAADGGWYCNGSGSETTRNITINNVVAGDKIVVYAGQHLSGDTFGPITYHFDGLGLAVGQNDSASLGETSRVFKKFVFIAENSGSYKIWPECENGGKPLYNRVMRIPGVSVSGSVNFGSFNIGSDYTIKFVNQTTKQETIIELAEDGSFKTALASGYTYMAVLSGAAGYGFASEGKYVEIAENSDAIENVTLVVEEKDRYTYSGKLTGFEEGYDISRIAITMLPPADSSADEVELTIDKEAKGFTALLDSGVEYTLEMTGVDDYNVKDPLTVKNTADVTSDITVELKPRYTVSGGFIGLGDAEITELRFTYIDADGKTDSNYAYTATVTGGSYSIDLRDGSYLASAVVEGYKTQTHVVVNGDEVTKDLLFVSTASDTTLERVANLYVGYPNKPNNYKTVSAAVKAAKRMKPSNESERITIHIAPGTYREQIIVDVPYITFTNDEAPKEVKLTWYYGIGYAYYSIKSGYYNEESAHDKYEKANADRWGCAVRVAASDFRAENIVFENSFNRYITEEEIADGVELHTEGTDSGITFVRKADTTEKEAASKAATERAAAIALDADRAEFYQCEFYGSQDTVYTGSKGVHSYFKDCLMEGNTDFMFGDSNSVYDNCKLSFAGYSDAAYAGMIAVNQAESLHGYLFWGCTIVKGTTWNNGYGDLGRPWRANARVTFVNTVQETADIITARGWQDMSGASATDNPNYKEYNTTSLDGKTITMESPRKDKYVTENPVEDMTVYFDGWTPSYLDYDASQVVKDPVSDEKRSDVPKGTTITLTSATEGAKIYYTMDGTEPTASSTEYTAPISLGDEAKTITIKAIAIKGDIQSNIAVFEYNVVDAENLIAAPTATVEPGKVEKGTKVKLVCATEGADIYYTTDGTEPAVKSALLYKNQEIVINQTTTIKAIAEKGGNVSTVAEFTYTVEAPVTEVVEAPEADVTPGKVAKGTTVSLTCATEGAVIYYTMDETEPTEKSMVYTAPISLGNEVRKVIIKAIAVKAGKTSTVSTFEYAVSEDGTVEKQQVQAPKATPAAGAVAAGTTVTLTSDTADAKIYYTTDGRVPTAADTLYTEPIAITAAVTIQAVAVKEGWKDSEVVAFAYTITGEPDVPPVDVKRIKLEECEITVPSVMRDTSKKADPKQPSATYVTYKYTDESGEEKHVKFAENLDYSVVWNGAASAEDKTVYSVTLTGLGRTVDQFEIDTESTVTVNYKVYDKPDKNSKVKIVDISKAKIGLDASAKTEVYTGYAIEPKLDFTKDKDNLKDKVNIAYRNNINAGKATVTISAKPDAGDENTVYVGSKTLTFTIKKAALNKTAAKATAKVVWDESFSFTAGHDYTGTPVTVTGLKVESSKGRTLEPDEDYTVTYKNNAKAGKATVTVKGIGNNLSGSWTQSFTIKQVDLSKLKLNKDVKPAYSPKGARLAEIEVLGENGEKLYTLKEGTDYTAKYVYSDKKKAAGSKVTVTISGKGACTGKNIPLGEFEIAKGDFATCITVPEDIAVDGKDLAKELAKAIKVTDASGAKLSVKKNYTIGTPDKKTKTVELKPVDTKNYENSYIVKFRVATNLAKDKGFVFDKKATLSYDGRNPVKLTADDITKYVGAKYKLGENIEIVPGTYKNNTKKGTASVTVRGKAGVDGGFYGTKVLKFKIVEK